MKGKGLARKHGELSGPGQPAVNCLKRLTFLGMQELYPGQGRISATPRETCWRPWRTPMPLWRNPGSHLPSMPVHDEP